MLVKMQECGVILTKQTKKKGTFVCMVEQEQRNQTKEYG